MSMVNCAKGRKEEMSMGIFLKRRECQGEVGLNICNMEHITNLAEAKRE